MKTMTTVDLASHLADTASQVIDVRERNEYKLEFLPGTTHIPLSDFDAHIDKLDRQKRTIVLCRSGARSRKAAERLIEAGWTDVHIVDGGLVAWSESGGALTRARPNVWSLERQIRFTAGLLVMLGAFGAMLIHPALIWLAAFVGTGLVFAAASNICLMGQLLLRLPWNRA